MAWETGRMSAYIRNMDVSYRGLNFGGGMPMCECSISFSRPSDPEDLENVVEAFRGQLLELFFPDRAEQIRSRQAEKLRKSKEILKEKRKKAKKEEPKPVPGSRDIEY